MLRALTSLGNCGDWIGIVAWLRYTVVIGGCSDGGGVSEGWQGYEFGTGPLKSESWHAS
jgi:hypothetical protein